jgi:hypothetical protein
VQYAVEHGCPWDVRACSDAVRRVTIWVGIGPSPAPAELVQALSVPPKKARRSAGPKRVIKEGNQTHATPPKEVTVLFSPAIKLESNHPHETPTGISLSLNKGIKREREN